MKNQKNDAETTRRRQRNDETEEGEQQKKEGVAHAQDDEDSEIYDKPTCLSQAANQGIPADFAEMVHVDWFSREGKDGGGLRIP